MALLWIVWLYRYCWHNYIMMWGGDGYMVARRNFCWGGGASPKKAPQIEKKVAENPTW